MEIWKDIEGFEGLYQVSNLGNVKSLNYRRMGYSQNLTPKTNIDGYLWVELSHLDNIKHELIHRLVAKAFIQNPNNYNFVNHKDEDKANNCVDNLEWCTHRYNVAYSLRLHPQRTRCRKPYKWLKRVRQIDKNSGIVIREYACLNEVKKILGKNDYGIRQCCLGKRQTAYGYKWEFCE